MRPLAHPVLAATVLAACQSPPADRQPSPPPARDVASAVIPAAAVAYATADGEVAAPRLPTGPVVHDQRRGDVREEIALRIRALLDDADVAEASGDAVLAQALRADAARLVRGPVPAPDAGVVTVARVVAPAPRARAKASAPRPIAVTARRAAAPRRPAPRPTPAAPLPVVVSPVAPQVRPATPAALPATVPSVVLAGAVPPPAPAAPATPKRTRRLGALVGASAGWIVGGLVGNIPGLIIMGAATGIAGSKKTAEAAKQTVARDSAAAAATAARDSTPPGA